MNQQELELFDLYDLWYEPFWHKPWFWPIVVTVILLLAALVVYWFVKKRMKTKQIIKEPWQEALEQLAILKVHECKSITARKQFYSNLTYILKRYLIRRYGIALESKTDEEIIVIIQNSEFPVELFATLSTIFNGAQYIKFAHQDAALEQMNYDLEHTISIIKSTGSNTPS